MLSIKNDCPFIVQGINATFDKAFITEAFDVSDDDIEIVDASNEIAIIHCGETIKIKNSALTTIYIGEGAKAINNNNLGNTYEIPRSTISYFTMRTAL